jgi:enterochelin esterase family protein
VILHTLAVLLALVGGSPARAGEVDADRILRSETLGRELPYALYLPDAYAAEPDRRFPVVYLLHGHGGDSTTWVRAGELERTADRLIETGAIPPLIVVMPGVGNSWYVDSAGSMTGGMMAKALVRDLVGHIDAHLRTIAGRSGRALAGQSMGGFGALHLAFRHPDRFVAVASLSGALFVAMPGPATTRDLFGDVFGEPFEPAAYRAASPLGHTSVLAAGGPVPAIYLASGDDDYFGFWRGAALLFMELHDAGIPAELRITDGGHDWTYWADALDPALRFVAARLATR